MCRLERILTGLEVSVRIYQNQNTVLLETLCNPGPDRVINHSTVSMVMCVVIRVVILGRGTLPANDHDRRRVGNGHST